jgi:polysaccharide biosynthesis protein PslH
MTELAHTLRLLVAVPFAPRLDNLHGGRTRAQFLRRMTARHRVVLVYQRRPDERPVDDEVTAGCERVVEVGLSSSRIDETWRHRLDIVKATLIGRPTSASAVYSAEFVRTVREIARSWQPDVIQLEHDPIAYCAPALVGFAPVRLLVCYEPGMIAAEHMIAITTGRQRLAHRIDAHAWRRYWRSNLTALDAVVALTPEDDDALRSVIPNLRVQTIPLGIDLPEEPLSPSGSEASVLFVGGYTHYPNADAALRLMRSIMPAARLQIPELQLNLVGDRPTKQMLATASEFDQISGRVPDIQPYLDRSAVVALPIRVGGGMRVKLLEAMAAGKAIIASPLATSGLRVRDGDQLLIAGSDAAFAENVVRLMRDRPLRERLGREARRFAERHLGWDSLILEYEGLYRSLAQGSGLLVEPTPPRPS